MSQSRLFWTVISRFVLVFLALAAFLFFSAGTWNYWQAWVYLGMMLVMMTVVLAYLFKNDPKLLERRMRLREKETEQKRIVNLSLIPFLALYILPGLDLRFGWSQVPPGLSLLADGLVLAGYVLVWLVFRENSYTSRIIEVEPGQRVISSGPYAVIRHPMYAGSLLLYIFSPLALGSFWTVLLTLSIVWVLVARIKNEEAVLTRDLPGYAEYLQKVKYRLIPGLW